ncbi:hypothetical protein HanIR_Chr14g0691981 [Helianthus annuus]|nr:hypothetical protein HanIR_Chr14g0691981 [Helianthus annuus]
MMDINFYLKVAIYYRMCLFICLFVLTNELMKEMIQVGLINHLDVRRNGYEKKPLRNDFGLPNKVT